MTRRTSVAAARPGFRSARLGGIAAGALLATGCMADLGTSEVGQETRLAFVKHPGEDMVALGGPYVRSEGGAINDHGVIVGSAANAGERSHAVIWKADGTPRDIEVDASYESYAVDVNNGGLVIGSAVDLTSEGT